MNKGYRKSKGYLVKEHCCMGGGVWQVTRITVSNCSFQLVTPSNAENLQTPRQITNATVNDNYPFRFNKGK